MARVRVKICGITNEQDAIAAVAAGADALGFNFFSGSPRYVSPWRAREIIGALPPYVSSVGLFVNAEVEEVRQVSAQSGVANLQFHGDEEPDFCSAFGLPWMRVLRVRSAVDLGGESQRWAGASGLMLDAWNKDLRGGTGETFDWALARGDASLPLVLAGGLNAANVEAAIAAVRPWAVDVSSGVESEPGRKDVELMQAFVAATQAGSRRLD